MTSSWSAACRIAVVALTVAGAVPGARGASAEAGRPRNAEPANDPPVPPVRLDAVATDQQGRAVLDLRASDFEIRVDGVSRALTDSEFRALHRPAGTAEPQPRVFGFLLDEFHVRAGVETERVRTSLARFIGEHLRPGDRGLILKPLDQVASIRFIDNRDALLAAVSSFSGRKGDLSSRSSFEEQFIGRAPVAVAAARAQIVTVALTELALRLGEMNADRAAIVLVSEGFQRPPTSRGTSRLPDLQGVVRAASRFHFPVYTFSPADMPPAHTGTTELEPAAATLEWLARETGGVSVLDGSRLAPGLVKLAADLDAYYSVTFQPAAADGRYHPVQMLTKRPGVVIRAAPGYWAPLSNEVRAWLTRSPSTMDATPGRALKRSAMIEAWSGLERLSDGRRGLVVSWEPGARNAAAAARPMPAQVELTARAASGAVLFQGTLARAGERGSTPDVARFEVPAGGIELDMRILAANGALLDSDVRDLNVPDLAAGNPAVFISPQVIRARTMNEFRAVTGNADAVPTAARTFSRSERLVIRVPAWSRGGLPVRVIARVLNRVAQPMRTLDPAAAGEVSQFELSLAWLPPGEYYIEITGQAGSGTARERIPLRVRPS